MTKAKPIQAKEASGAVKPYAPKAKEMDRIKAVAAKQAARADGPPMKLKIVDGVLQIAFTHDDTALAHRPRASPSAPLTRAFISPPAQPSAKRAGTFHVR